MKRLIAYCCLSLFSLLAVFTTGCQKKASLRYKNYSQLTATVDKVPFETNNCDLYNIGNFWIVDGNSYRGYTSGPLYPRVQFLLHKFAFDTGTFNIGTDSVTAYYFTSPTDTIKALSGTVHVTAVSSVICSGIGGTFNVTFKDGTVFNNGAFTTGPYCAML